jgi:hypothetical protein
MNFHMFMDLMSYYSSPNLQTYFHWTA